MPSIVPIFRALGLAILWSSSVYSQTYHPIPAQGTWIYKFYDDFGHPLLGQAEFKTRGDTSLDGHIYYKLYLDELYNGAIRDSSKQVFFRPAEDTLEHVLYDFNKMLGDTIITPYPMQALGYSCDTMVVYSESQLPTGAGPRRQLGLSACNGVYWIESMGNTWWLTSPAYLGSLSGGSYLSCFFDSTFLVYPLDSGDCSAAVQKEPELDPYFPVFPNPSNGFLNIPMNMAGTMDIYFFDVAGRVVKQFPHAGTILDISALPEGVYMLVAQTKTHTSRSRVIKLNSP